MYRRIISGPTRSVKIIELSRDKLAGKESGLTEKGVQCKQDNFK